MINDNTYQGTTTGGNITSGIYPSPQKGICPGCGRCKECGRPQDHQFQPWPGYPQPYIGDPIWPYPGTTWIGTVTCGQSNQTINSGWMYNC